jgi:hypothetical protein
MTDPAKVLEKALSRQAAIDSGPDARTWISSKDQKIMVYAYESAEFFEQQALFLRKSMKIFEQDQDIQNVLNDLDIVKREVRRRY